MNESESVSQSVISVQDVNSYELFLVLEYEVFMRVCAQVCAHAACERACACVCLHACMCACVRSCVHDGWDLLIETTCFFSDLRRNYVCVCVLCECSCCACSPHSVYVLV